MLKQFLPLRCGVRMPGQTWTSVFGLPAQLELEHLEHMRTLKAFILFLFKYILVSLSHWGLDVSHLNKL